MSAPPEARTRKLAERIAAIKPNPAVSFGRSLWPFLVAVVLAFVLQVAIAPMLGAFYAKTMLDIGIAIVLASSLNIVNGFAGQFSIGHAGFMMVGGYAAACVTYYGSIKLLMPADELADAVGVTVLGGFLGAGDLLFLVSCVVGGIVAALAGIVVGLPSLRLRGDYLAIVTLGFGEIVRVLVQQTDDVPEPIKAVDVGVGHMVKHLGGPLGFTGTPTYVSPTPWATNASGDQTGHAGIFFAYSIVGILLILVYRLKTSSKGRALLAVRENEVAAEAMGVDTARSKVTAFVIAAFFAGVGGALYAHSMGVTLNPNELGFQKSIDLVIMVVLGGMGSITGVVFAAAFLTVLPELFREAAQAITQLVGYEGQVNTDAYRMPVYALLLILVMILRPQGLFGIKELWDLGFWRRYVIPVWRKVAGGWLIPKHEAKMPTAIARELSSERVGADPAHSDDSPKPGSGGDE